MGFIYLEIVLYDWRPEESDDLSLFPVTCVPSGWRVMLSLLRFGWRCIQKKIQLLYFRGSMRVLECFKQIQPRNMWGSVPICYLSPWLCRHYEYINCCNLIFSFSKAYWCFQISYSTQHDASKEEKLTVRWEHEITKEP